MSVYTASVYEWHLVRIPSEEPLFDLKYFGQVVRVGDSEKTVKDRWNKEIRDAFDFDRKVGLLHCIRVYGVDAFDRTILASMQGCQEDAQNWADSLETKLIRDNGGVLKDTQKRLRQTLNILPGGKGKSWWKANAALRSIKFSDFQAHLLDFVKQHSTAYVRQSYVCDDGYRLGVVVSSVRKGGFWKGHPMEYCILEWINSQPGWAWVAKDSEEYHKVMVKVGHVSQEKSNNCGKILRTWWNDADSSTKKSVSAKTTETKRLNGDYDSENAKLRYEKAIENGHDTLNSRLQKWRSENPEEAKLIRAKTKATISMPGWKDAQSKRMKEKAQAETTEARNSRLEKYKSTCMSKRAEKESSMSPKQIAKASKLRARKVELNNIVLAQLKLVPGWENAVQRDIPRARSMGAIPKRFEGNSSVHGMS